MLLTIHHYQGQRDKILELLKKHKIKRRECDLTQDDKARDLVVAYGDMWQVELLRSFFEVQTVAWRHEEEKTGKVKFPSRDPVSTDIGQEMETTD